jgi:hypothetical protein
MVDAGDLKSSGATRAGSSPALGTRYESILPRLRAIPCIDDASQRTPEDFKSPVPFRCMDGGWM